MSDWNKYNESQSLQPPRPRLVKTLDRFFANRAGHALDLGCGSGRDMNELLNRGWTVDGQDGDKSSLEAAEKLLLSHRDRVRWIHSSFEALALPEAHYDLINASYSLPFCRRESFPELWKKTTAALKPGGILTCELFGMNDSWFAESVDPGERTFLSLEEVNALLAPLQTESLKEEEFDGPAFGRPLKHWHLFYCIARRTVVA